MTTTDKSYWRNDVPPHRRLRLNHPQPPPPLSDSSTVVGVTGAGMGVTCSVGGAGGHYRARSGRGRRRREVAASRGGNRLDVQSTDDIATVRVSPRIRVDDIVILLLLQ